jgi:predicted ATPase
MVMSARPYLRSVSLKREGVPNYDAYPFCIPAVRELHNLRFHSDVTFIVGENGCGKSTLLEGIAAAWGFNPEGGTVNFRFSTRASHSELHTHLRLVKSVQLIDNNSQFIIATHSPILMAYPRAKIFLVDNTGFTAVRYEETEHYAVTKEFLADPARILGQLFGDDERDA